MLLERSGSCWVEAAWWSQRSLLWDPEHMDGTVSHASCQFGQVVPTQTNSSPKGIRPSGALNRIMTTWIFKLKQMTQCQYVLLCWLKWILCKGKPHFYSFTGFLIKAALKTGFKLFLQWWKYFIHGYLVIVTNKFSILFKHYTQFQSANTTRRQ